MQEKRLPAHYSLVDAASRTDYGEKEFSIAVLIPALQPELVLVALTNELLEAGIGAVVVEDDGSESPSNLYFRGFA